MGGVAAICAYPALLDAECMPADTKQRARQILQHLQGGSPGSYNLEYVTDTVAKKVARYLEQRDNGIPSDPHCIVPCSGTASDVVSLVVDERAAQPTGVLVPVPGPPLHAAAAGLAGAVAVPYPLAEEQGWAVAGEALRQVLRQARVRCHPKPAEHGGHHPAGG
uniref:alanine transaminase n=1 Tax=Falco tinnunculus TaxID=100819 RepID=A0A8C4XNX8_FALTI